MFYLFSFYNLQAVYKSARSRSCLDRLSHTHLPLYAWPSKRGKRLRGLRIAKFIKLRTKPFCGCLPLQRGRQQDKTSQQDSYTREKRRISTHTQKKRKKKKQKRRKESGVVFITCRLFFFFVLETSSVFVFWSLFPFFFMRPCFFLFFRFICIFFFKFSFLFFFFFLFFFLPFFFFAQSCF